MDALSFLKEIPLDRSELLIEPIDALRASNVRYCVIETFPQLHNHVPESILGKLF